VRLTSIFNHWGYTFNATHHIEDGDSVATSMVMLRQTVKVDVYVPEMIQVVSNVLILTNKGPRQMFI